MSVLIQGYQLRTIALGAQVTKSALALPQSATATLFTVAGGPVLITSLVGIVSTAIQNQACNLSLGTVPTTGTSSTTGIATATAITNKEAGTMVVPLVSAGVAGALVVGGNAGASLFLPTPFVVSAGTITWTTSASNTGNMTWYATYVPVIAGASLS